jgi:poly(A) polymerase
MPHLLHMHAVVEPLSRRFEQAGFELALVGGSVRDAALDRPGTDIDLTTSARPEDVESLIAGYADAVWDVGRAFGTIALRKGPATVEITTYRADEYQRGSRKPEVTYGMSLEGDLHRRDFTVNAMAVTLPELRLVDPFDGLSDLAAGRLRTPASPQESFDDDPLRMMRAARFAAQLGFTVDFETALALAELSPRIAIVSAERIRDELVKLMLSPSPRLGLEILVDSGLADHVLPELPRLRMEIDEHRRHKDVYTHSLTVLEQAIDLEHRAADGPDLVLRLAALLHDIGKPDTRRFGPDGAVSFHHHEVVGARMVRKRLTALRLPKDVVNDVARLTELHLRFHGYGSGEWSDSAVRRYARDAGDLLSRLHVLTRADSTTRNQRRAVALQRSYDDLERRLAELAAAEELSALRPDLDGRQIMQVLGIGPGPAVGRAYQHLLEVRIESGPMEREEAERELLRWWRDSDQVS